MCYKSPGRSLRWNLREGAYFSSSSSMKPLLSWSMTAKAFLMSSALLPARPTLAKKSLCLKESAAVRRQRAAHIRPCEYSLAHKKTEVYVASCFLVLGWWLLSSSDTYFNCQSALQLNLYGCFSYSGYPEVQHILSVKTHRNNSKAIFCMLAAVLIYHPRPRCF